MKTFSFFAVERSPEPTFVCVTNVPRAANSKADRGVSRIEKKGAERLALAIVLLLHLAATCIVLPPWEILRREPLRGYDHPIHAHRVFMYRQGLLQSGVPWGYDPSVSAGVVMHPAQDAGAKPQQVLGVLLPFLTPGMVVRLFIFTVVLSFPIWTLLACRRLGLPTGAQVWVMVSLLAPAWLYHNLNTITFIAGALSYCAVAYFAPYVLVLFLDFLAHPRLRTYVAFFFAAALLFLLHVLGPVPLLLPLVLLSLLSCRSLTPGWRVAVLLAPVGILVLNAFWFFPFVLALDMPRPPWPSLPGYATTLHQTYTSWSDLAKSLTAFRVTAAFAGISLGAYGLTVLKRVAGSRVVVAFALAAASALFLKFFGSFLPIFIRMQPARFIVPAFALLTLPVGVTLFTLVQKTRLPAGLSAAALALLVAVLAAFLGKPLSIQLPPSPDPLVDFVASRTTSAERLLVQSRKYEPKIFPVVFGQEVIGNTFPVENDPAQFLIEHGVYRPEMLLGKDLHTWSAGELRSALERWGVAWAFTWTEEARALFAEVTGSPGEVVGEYHAFRMPSSPSRFLVGKGHVLTKINRLELTKLRPEDGLVVLRYRYHPAWQTTTGVRVLQYPIPEDPSGFIALRNPPEAVTLQFNGWAMFRAPWPR